MERKKIGFLYSKQFNSFKLFDVKGYLSDKGDIEILYPYTNNVSVLKEALYNYKIPILEMKSRDLEFSYVKTCKDIVNLSDEILILCEPFEIKTAFIKKSIIKYACDLDKKGKVYKVKNQKFYNLEYKTLEKINAIKVV